MMLLVIAIHRQIHHVGHTCIMLYPQATSLVLTRRHFDAAVLCLVEQRAVLMLSREQGKTVLENRADERSVRAKGSPRPIPYWLTPRERKKAMTPDAGVMRSLRRRFPSIPWHVKGTPMSLNTSTDANTWP